MQRMLLSGDYKLGLCDDKDFFKINQTISSYDKLVEAGIKVIDSVVPSNFEVDMMKAGLLPDIFYGKNLLLSQKLEMMHLFYVKKFTVEKKFRDSDIYFEGIDTFSEVYLNGVKIGETDNMFIPQRMNAKSLIVGENELLVHIIPASIMARKNNSYMYSFALKYNYDNLNIRKSNYMSGWDIFPRIMSGGIWKDVYLETNKSIKIEQNYLYTSSLSQDYTYAEIVLFYELDLKREPYAEFKIRIEGECKNSKFAYEDRVWSKAGRLNIEIKNPKLWWPRGNGEQNLYNVQVTLFHNDKVVDRREFKHGIRTVKLDRTSVTDLDGNGEFCFYVNYKKVFIMGTNWVPLDSFPSRSKKKIEDAIKLVEDIGCNMIRCWGGGYYEDERFYELCDEKGFMVWQDFMMSCGMYPQEKELLEKLEKEFTTVVRNLRQHPSIVLWAGDNECDCACEWAGNHTDPNDNVITRKLIPYIVRMNDYVRPYLPSSPYMDEESYKKGTEFITENHLWGPRDYYKGDFYKNSLAHFASEIGYHGSPAVKSIKKFISEKALWPYDNEEWVLHASSPEGATTSPYAYRIKLMVNQIKVLFNYLPHNLEEFVLLSQISQAEAKKYFIEKFRTSKWRRTGIIWWNILDGCPQFSDAVVDYYFEKKLAYYYIKSSQQKICFMFGESIEDKTPLYFVNDTNNEIDNVSYTIRSVKNGKILLSGTASVRKDTSEIIAYIKEIKNFDILEIKWIINGEEYFNHYTCGEAPYPKDEYVKYAKEIELFRDNN